MGNICKKIKILSEKKNIVELKRYMFKKGSAFKSEIAKETGISVVTVNALVKQLVEEHVLLEGKHVQQSLGRPAIIYHFNYEQQLFLLLSIQETFTIAQRNLVIVGKIVNLSGKINYEEEFSFKNPTLKCLLSIINHFLLLDYRIDKIGISLPGKIFNGVVLSSWNNLFNQWNLEQAISEITSIPVFIQNDAHLLTIGYTILSALNKNETIVGIFYPENSMPGITIYSNGSLIEGSKHLAGKAKFLPHLINTSEPIVGMTLVDSLIKILAIYNVVIAPDSFVISADSVSNDLIIHKVTESAILSKQINKPHLLSIQNFQKSLDTGLRWLVTKNSTYRI